MLISNKKQNIIKKTTSILFLSLFLLSFVLPYATKVSAAAPAATLKVSKVTKTLANGDKVLTWGWEVEAASTNMPDGAHDTVYLLRDGATKPIQPQYFNDPNSDTFDNLDVSGNKTHWVNFINLKPNTSYVVKSEYYSSANKLLTSATLTQTTPKDDGSASGSNSKGGNGDGTPPPNTIYNYTYATYDNTDQNLLSCITSKDFTDQPTCTAEEKLITMVGSVKYVPHSKMLQSCQLYDVNSTKPAPCLGAKVANIVANSGNIATNTNYTLLAPLPDGNGGQLTNFESDPTKNPCAFGKYMNTLIKIVLGISAVLAMIMIIKGGFEYMGSSLPSGKESGKGTIMEAILGLIIALSAYLILYTINPDLLNFCIDKSLPNVNITIEPLSAQQERVTQNLSSNRVFKRTKYYNDIKILVGNKFPHCIMQATTQIEGGGASSQLIGHDENVKSSQIKSRRDFIASGKKFSGTTFVPISDAKNSIQNDDGKNSSVAPKPSDPTLGLDLRFSHSVGMFGTTFFPPNGTIADGSNFTMQQIYNNTNNADLKWATGHAEKGYNTCGKDPQKVFYYWGGSCKTPTAGSWNAMVSAQKMDLYNQCLKQDN
ncbi:MAG: pilin [bacterium]